MELTTGQAAKILKTTPIRINQLIKDGKIKAMKRPWPNNNSLKKVWIIQKRELEKVSLNRRERNKVFCKINNCNKRHYAKGFCSYHYRQIKKNGIVTAIKTKKCKWPGCKSSFRLLLNNPSEIYCLKHRIIKTTPGKERRHPTNSGEKHYKWKGGISEYPKQTTMIKLKKEIFKEYNGKCNRCGSNAKEIHHIDGSKDNHIKENLEPLCYKCHRAIHSNAMRKPKGTSKYKRMFGITLIEMSKLCGVSYWTAYNWIITGKLTKDNFENFFN